MAGTRTGSGGKEAGMRRGKREEEAGWEEAVTRKGRGGKKSGKE